jgi:hypothetical protein
MARVECATQGSKGHVHNPWKYPPDQVRSVNPLCRLQTFCAANHIAFGTVRFTIECQCLSDTVRIQGGP